MPHLDRLNMPKTLVIVESPTKAKTIAKFLGRDYQVESSFGHVRDLPKSIMGVDIAGGTFQPEYEIPATKKKRVAALRKFAKEANNILFATDEDREGEAISWHLAELLKIDPAAVKRLVFHEITKTAIETALRNPRGLDINLVDAQQARRVLDRLVGYELSPLLWKKVRYGLSAGRVQSVAVNLIVEREKERSRFVTSHYFDLIAELGAEKNKFSARLITYNQKAVPAGKDFDSATGQLKNPADFILLNETEAKELAKKLAVAKPWRVAEIAKNPYQTHPYPPFITSTLQQEGHRKLGWGAKLTMRVAQSLYENGYITYMRTDSVHLSDQAVRAAREAVCEFGQEYLSEKPKVYSTKSKLSQEAHEAIRPAGQCFTHPRVVAGQVTADEAALYELIWKRTVASQMKSAKMISLSLKIVAEKAVFETKGKQIEFAGYLRAYVEGTDDPEAELEDKEITLPDLAENQIVNCETVAPEGHATAPPARYTEASLIKKLESEGVGRPSTYAAILDTIIAREYVIKNGQALTPTYTAMIVDSYLQQSFNELVDLKFTAKMEADLDAIAAGAEKWIPYIKNFYGTDQTGFHGEIKAASETDYYPNLELGASVRGEKIIIRSGKYGPYLQKGEGENKLTAPLPDSLPPADLNVKVALELLEKPQGPVIICLHDTGVGITHRTGRYGPYLQLGEDGETKAKKSALTYGPKHLPISPSLDLNNITPEQAKKIISFPLTIGESQGEKIIASVGRFGPYLKRDDDFRSIPKDKDILNITLTEAEEIFAQEKKGRGRKSKIIKELGADPDTGKPVQVLEGPYGPYVSNGTRVFATVPKDAKPEDVTLSQALDLINKKIANKKKKKK